MRILIITIAVSAALVVSTTSAQVTSFSRIATGQRVANGRAAGKPVRYVPVAQDAKDVVVPMGTIPVYYCTGKGLAQAKKEGPVFLGFDFAVRYYGRVVGLTEKTVTIKPEGSIQCNAIRFNSDKTVQDERVYLQDNSEPPRVFKFTEHLRYWSRLRAAPPPGGLSPYEGHTIRDLQMGDVILIRCSRFVDGLDYCDHAEIHRRPAGRVPPILMSPMTEKLWPKDTPRFHERMNAEQAGEEKAVASVQRMLLRLIR